MQGAQYSSPPLALPHPRGISSDPVRYGLSKKKADRWRRWGAGSIVAQVVVCSSFYHGNQNCHLRVYDAVYYKAFIVQKGQTLPSREGRETIRFPTILGPYRAVITNLETGLRERCTLWRGCKGQGIYMVNRRMAPMSFFRCPCSSSRQGAQYPFKLSLSHLRLASCNFSVLAETTNRKRWACVVVYDVRESLWTHFSVCLLFVWQPKGQEGKTHAQPPSSRPNWMAEFIQCFRFFFSSCHLSHASTIEKETAIISILILDPACSRVCPPEKKYLQAPRDPNKGQGPGFFFLVFSWFDPNFFSLSQPSGLSFAEKKTAVERRQE